MKRYIFLLIILLVTGLLNAQGLRVESSDGDGIRLHYTTPSVDMSKELPELPSAYHYIAVPKEATIIVNVREEGHRTFSGIDLSRVSETIEGAVIPERDIVTIRPTTIRGLDVALLSVTPYRYNKMQKTIELVQDIDIDIRFEGGNGQFGDSRYLNPDWEHILRNLVINKEMLPASDYYSLINSAREYDDGSCEYLIIAPDDAAILALADTLKDFRTKQGILTRVVSLSECGGNEADNIRNYIINAYNTWNIPPAAVLLFGGYRNGAGIAPFFHWTIADEYSTHRYPTDYPYCDMNGDSLPDLAISRITARNLEDYQAFVEKTIQYESNPPTDAAYYDNPIITAGHVDNKWFMIGSQSANGFFRNKLGKQPANFYMLHDTQVDPPDSIWSTGYNASLLLNYFGPNGQNYIPEYIGDLHEWITKNDTVPLHTALNNGSFLTIYRGHSNFNAWWFPRFNNTSLATLIHEPPTFVYSVSCSTALFTEETPGLIDAFCIKEHGGAVGGIGSASLTHSYFNDILAWGLYDCIWPNFLPDMGGDNPPLFVRPSYALANAKFYFDYHYFLPGWWINKENSTRHLFCYTGETYLNLFTETPQPLQITHGLFVPTNTNEFTVTAEEGAKLCLSRDGEIIGVEQSHGQSCTFALPDLEEGERIIFTATKQNHFRYEYEIPVISSNGPYVVVERDGLLVGEDSGILHNGEDACVGLKLHNYGNDAATNVTMRLVCESPFIEITQATCQIQNMAPNQTVVLNNAFCFSIDDDIPDMTEVVFDIFTDDGNGEKEFHVVKSIAAPTVVIEPEITYRNSNHQSVLQLENTGNNDIHIQIANKGHFDSKPVNVYLEILAPFIMVESPSRTFNTIEKGSINDVSFSVSVQDNALDQCWLMSRITLDDGGRKTVIDTLIPFGGFNETFDPDHFNQQNWQMSGNASWMLTDDNPHSGEYCVKSGEISHQQSTSIAITRATPATEISFFKKMSSELNYDKLHFYIDDEDMGEWSGSRPWSKERYPVVQGLHTFRWSYIKDVSVSLPPDCAWIDDVNIDPEPKTIAYSGGSLIVCRDDESVNIDCSYAYNYNNLEWTTSGDGYFDDPRAINPEYFPGSQDVNNGAVTLLLNVDGLVSPLQLIIADEINSGNAIIGDDIVSPEVTAFSHYYVEAQDGVTYIWQLEPAEAGHIFAHGYEADIAWNRDSDIAEVTLTVSAGSCSQPLEKAIHISLLATDEQIASPFTIFPNPTHGSVSLCIDKTVQGEAVVEVFNMLGDRMIVEKVSPSPAGEPVSLDMSRLAKGLYVVRLSAKTGSYSTKVSVR